MIIKNIKLNNFRSYSSFEKTFTKKINVITGGNGKGKTTILKAIDYAINGETDDATLSESIKRGQKDCNISMSLNYCDIPYSFSRQLTKGKGTKSTSDGSINKLDNTSDTQSIASGSSEMNEWVDNNFPNKTLLSASNFAIRSNSDFTSVRPAERFKELVKTLSLEKWQRRATKCKEDSDELKISIANYEGELNSINTYLQNYSIEEIKIKPEEYDVRIENQKKDQSPLKIEIDKCTEQLNNIAKKNKEYYDLETKIKELKDKRQDTNQDLEHVNTYIYSYSDTVRKLDTEIANLKDAKSRIVLKRVPVFDENKLHIINEKLLELRVEKERLEERKKLEDKGSCPTCSAPFDSSEKEKTITSLTDIGVKLDTMNRSLTVYKKDKEAYDLIVESNNKNKNKIKDLDHNISSKENDKISEEKINLEKQKTIALLEKNIKTIDVDLDIAGRSFNEMELVVDIDIKTKKAEYQDKYNIIQVSIDNLINEKADLVATIKQHKEKKKEKKDKETRKVILENDILIDTQKIEQLKHLKGLFEKTIPLSIILNKLKSVQVIANNFLQKVYPKYLLTFEEKKDKLLILMHDTEVNNEPFEFTTLSGFEESVVKLAIRLGLTSFQPDVKCMFLDEFDKAATDKNSQAVVEAIIDIADRFEQLFIVTHKDFIKDYLESLDNSELISLGD